MEKWGCNFTGTGKLAITKMLSGQIPLMNFLSLDKTPNLTKKLLLASGSLLVCPQRLGWMSGPTLSCSKEPRGKCRSAAGQDPDLAAQRPVLSSTSLLKYQLPVSHSLWSWLSRKIKALYAPKKNLQSLTLGTWTEECCLGKIQKAAIKHPAAVKRSHPVSWKPA